jgi:hypothetical protein
MGLDPNKIVFKIGSLDDPGSLQWLLRNPTAQSNPGVPGVHLYVELLQLSEPPAPSGGASEPPAPSGGPRAVPEPGAPGFDPSLGATGSDGQEASKKGCYALLLWANRQVIDTCLNDGESRPKPKFKVGRLKRATVTEALAEAMDILKTKTGKGQDFNARVVVALDVVDPNRLIEARDKLLRCVQEQEREAWFLVLPSAAALLSDSPWDAENVLRWAYRLAARLPMNPTPLWRSEGTKQGTNEEVSSVWSRLDNNRKALLLAFSQDPNAKPAGGGGSELHKVCGQLNNDPNVALTLPILVSSRDGEHIKEPSQSPGGRQ